jgi:regulatory protein
VAVITAIVPTSAQATRFSIAVDGQPAATVAIETIDRLSLSVGIGYDDVRLAVEHDARKLETYDRALNLLAASPRSARDLKRRLVLKGEPPEYADLAIEKLINLGLLNDADYARQLTRSKMSGPGHSRRRMQQELFKRGVNRDVADEAIADVMSDESIDTGAIIERIARRKAQSLAKSDPASRKRRLYDFLARRGYDHDDIQKAIATVLADTEHLSSEDDDSV